MIVVAISILVQVSLSTVWTTIADTVAEDTLYCQYGLRAATPTDSLAGPGESRVTLVNSAANAGTQQGWYSPAHASVRSGWGYDIPYRVVFHYEAPVTVSTLTRSGSTASATTASAHGLATGDYVLIEGANEADYNGVYQITVTGASTFDYPVSGTPASPATGTIAETPCYVKFRGFVDVIRPDAGAYGPQRAYVMARDYAHVLHTIDIRDVALATNTNESDLQNAILGALPTAKQLTGSSLDEGLDPIEIALYDIGERAKAATILREIVISSAGLGLVRGDGSYRYVNRNSRATTTSSLTLTDATLMGLEASADRSLVFNRVRVTAHPPSVASTVSVLAAATGDPPVVYPSDPRTIWLTYRDPDNTRRLVGGSGMVTTLVAGTDYSGNSASDGSGSDQTSNLSIAATAYASRVKLVITNNGSVPIYLVTAESTAGAKDGTTLLQVRGNAVLDEGSREVEVSTGSADLFLNIDAPYAGNDAAALQIGNAFLQLYGDRDQVHGVRFRADHNTTLLDAALRLEPGDAVTVSETVSGLSSVLAMIVSVRLTFGPGQLLWCEWGLAPMFTISPPNAPTSLSASVVDASTVDLSWTTGSGAGSAYTNIYRSVGGGDPALVAVVGAGVTTYTDSNLTVATTYTYTARHVENGLLSAESNSDTGRPTVQATGGTVTTPGDGYKYHTWDVAGTYTDAFQITGAGAIDFILVAGGAGGGRGSVSGSSWYGGGGGGGDSAESIGNFEPVGNYTVTVGAGGLGATSNGNSGTAGGSSTYRSTTVAGGGYGGGGASSGLAGGNGGSGGGGGSNGGAGGTATGLGNNGGTGGGDNEGGGGGSGMSGQGTNGSAGPTGGVGGGGFASTITGFTYGIGGEGGDGTTPGNGTTAGHGGDGSGPGVNAANGRDGLFKARYPI